MVAPTRLEEQMRIYDVVSQGLGRRPFESLKEAAQRCVRCSPAPNLRVRLASHIVLREVGSAWIHLQRAARVLEGGRA